MKPCLLYTLDGTFQATTSKPHRDWGGREVVTIKANDSNWQIDVPAVLVDHKFAGEEVPTFYAC